MTRPPLFAFHLSLSLLSLLAGCGEQIRPKATKYRFAPIVRTDLVRTVEATGKVTPRNSSNGIPVGAQVNGKVIRLFVDYNSPVTNGQVVALIDPLVYDANYKNALALLHVNEANVLVREASARASRSALLLAEKTFLRKKGLLAKELCSQSEYDEAKDAYDRARAECEGADASLASAKANVEQSQASVAKARADLDYCSIRSPVNGVVIARKVEEGETVVSSMNAVPVLTIAEDLKTVWIEATVPEADVGSIRVGQPVTFTADAYRRKFKGRVKQIRKFATTTNNVVTYPVIIEAENPDEMLFPGMTATLSVETARAEDVVVVSAAAFRFRPKEEDRPAGELPPGRRLWLVENGKLVPQAVKEGVSDASFTELLDADALEGREAVVGYETAATPMAGPDTTNPFMPKFPKHGAKGTAPAPKAK